MVSYFSLFAALSAFADVLVTGLATRQAQTLGLQCSNPDGECINGPGGQFSTIWNVTDGDAFVAKTWSLADGATVTCVAPKLWIFPALRLIPRSNALYCSNKTIQYSGTFEAEGTAWLGVIGVIGSTSSSYTVIENFVGESPASLYREVGSPVTADGGVYTLYYRLGEPNAIEQRAHEYLAVRTPKRIGGVIDMQTFFNAWIAAGMRFSPHPYQAFGLEATEGTGTAKLTVQKLGIDSPASSPSSSQPPQATIAGPVSPFPICCQ
jgi:endo-1,4-beta-xylanase